MTNEFLDIDSLEILRMRFDLIMIYKLINGFIDNDITFILFNHTYNPYFVFNLYINGIPSYNYKLYPMFINTF